MKLPDKPRILVIRRDNIGDLVCTSPALAALRQHYPKAEIGALVNSYNADVLRGNPNVDHVFVYQKLKHAGGVLNQVKAIAQRLKLIAKLRRWKPDVTVLAKSSYDRHGLNFARQIGAKNVIGFVPDDLRQTKGLPDIQMPTPAADAMHEVEAVNLLLAPLGIKDALGPLQVFPKSNTVAALAKSLPAAQQRIALHISAREAERRWGLDNFMALALHILSTQPDTQILLFWSPGKAEDPYHPGDDAAAETLIQAVHSNRLLPVPTQNPFELIAALSLCDIFIGTDGGAMHLAVALAQRGAKVMLFDADLGLANLDGMQADIEKYGMAVDWQRTGMLAVAIASPCTAPFMGASLGLAIALPAAQALAVFACLGLGMALPYLAVSLWPALAHRLPEGRVAVLAAQSPEAAIGLLAVLRRADATFAARQAAERLTPADAQLFVDDHAEAMARGRRAGAPLGPADRPHLGRTRRALGAGPRGGLQPGRQNLCIRER